MPGYFEPAHLGGAWVELPNHTKEEKPMAVEKQGFEQWAIVELFGHQRIAGKITEQTIGGCSFVRVDVPELPERVEDHYGNPRKRPLVAGFTKLYGQGAIYGMTFVDEAIAKASAAELRVMPVDSYTLQDAIRSANPDALKKMLAPPDTGRDDDELEQSPEHPGGLSNLPHDDDDNRPYHTGP